MQIDLDVQNLSAEEPGAPCQYNGHLIIHCEWFGELHVQCVACNEEKTEPVPSAWSEMTPNQKAIYWVKKIGEYDESCPNSASTMKEVVKDNVITKQHGKLATVSNKHRIEESIEQKLPEMYEASIEFDA